MGSGWNGMEREELVVFRIEMGYGRVVKKCSEVRIDDLGIVFGDGV